MAEIKDLNDADSGELTDSDAANIAGGQSQRLKLHPTEDTTIDTINSNGPVTQDVKHGDEIPNL